MAAYTAEVVNAADFRAFGSQGMALGHLLDVMAERHEDEEMQNGYRDMSLKARQLSVLMYAYFPQHRDAGNWQYHDGTFVPVELVEEYEEDETGIVQDSSGSCTIN